MKKESKSVWDSCSSFTISVNGKQLVALLRLAEKRGISRSKIGAMLWLESASFNSEMDACANEGLFEPCDTRYEDFKKKQELLK